MAIKIVTDSACDLSPEEVKEMDVTVVPLIVRFGEEAVPDSELTREEFWRRAQGSLHPRTSQPPIGSFVSAFKSLVQEGHQVLCLTITGKHSGTYNSAWAAAREFGDAVTVVDSMFISYGLGWQVKAAYEAAKRGCSMSQILEILSGLRQRMKLFILLDTIEYLEKGGRAASVISVLKRAIHFLNVKPMLTWDDGRLKLSGLARSYERGISRIVQEIKALKPLEKIGVLHTRRPQRARELAAKLARVTGLLEEKISVCETGVILSTHGGPGVVAAIGLQSK